MYFCAWLKKMSAKKEISVFIPSRLCWSKCGDAFLCVLVWLKVVQISIMSPLKDEDEGALNAVVVAAPRRELRFGNACFAPPSAASASDSRLLLKLLIVDGHLALIAVVVFFHTSGFPCAQHCIQVVLSQGNNKDSSSSLAASRGMRVTTIAFGLMTLLS